MNDFDYEVMQRKRLARQASHKKCGSKSKKCPMSTDHMTRKQWLEEYLLDMIHKYSTTASDLARLFGIGASTVTRHCGTQEIGIKFSPGKKMPKDKRDAFERLFLVEEGASPLPATTDTRDVVEAPTVHRLDMSKAKPSSAGMEMTDFSMSFQGDINVEMVVNSILAMLIPGSKVRLDVRCSVLT